MTLIHGYLLRQFFRAFLIFFVSFTGLYVIIDIFNNLEELISYGKSHGGLALTLFQYYSPRTLFFFDRSCSILILVSSMFTIATFQRHNEMTALLAAGISERKVVRPLILAAIGLCTLAVINREILIPSCRESLTTTAQDMASEKASDLKAARDSESDILISGEGVLVRDKTIVKPDFNLPKPLARYGSELLAETATYEPESEGRPSGYRLRGVEDPTLCEKPSFGYKDFKVILTPADTDWLADDEVFVVSHITFEQLTAGEDWRQFSSTAELIAAINNPSVDYGTNVRVSIHSRIVQPFLDITLFFLGLPLVLKSNGQRNKLIAIGKAALLVLVFMVGLLACQYLGSAHLVRPASLAAWLPLLLFAPAAVWMLEPLRERKPKSLSKTPS